MTGQEPPVRALELLRQRGVVVDDAADDPVRREAGIAVTRAALRRVRERRTRWLDWRVGAVALFAIFAGTGSYLYEGLTQTPDAPIRTVAAERESQLIVTAGVVVSTHDGEGRAATAPARVPLLPGDALRTASDGRARLELPEGVRIEVDMATKVWLERATPSEQQLRLDLGHVAVDVPESGAPKRVAIATPDSEVVVHGTRFAVTVAEEQPGEPPRTSVKVTRGAVWIRHGKGRTLVRAGHDWSSRPEPTVEDEKAETTAARSRRAAPQRRTTATTRPPPPVAPAAAERASELAAQNRLFHAALSARDNGEDAVVVRQLNTLLERYPSTPLDREARLMRTEALQRLRDKR